MRTFSNAGLWLFLRFIFPVCLGCGVSSGCADAPVDRSELIVAAAASLKDAFTEIGNRFEQRYPIDITFTFAGSNLLQRQIETGAPADVFASAASIQMNRLEERNFILPETRATFAHNTIVLIVPAESPLQSGSFEDLARDRVKGIALGAAGVPVRIYAEEALRHRNLWDTIEPKCVFGQNVRQVLDYVAQGEADAGIVYATDAAISPRVRTLAVAESGWHRPIEYPVAVVAASRNREWAGRFTRYILDDEAQTILKSHGFQGR